MTEQQFQATITVTEYSEMQYFLREHVADGTLPDGATFEVSSGIPTRSLIVEFSDGQIFLFDMREMINAALLRRAVAKSEATP